MTNERDDAEWAVEMVDGNVQITVADDDDVMVYTLDRYEAALIAGAIFETLEEENSEQE
jgi:hypothetical protein